MPVAYVDIPTGVSDSGKTKILNEIYGAVHEAWPIPDTRVLIREWPSEAVSQDGRIEDMPMRPICTVAAPPDLDLDAKHRLIRRISETIGEACSREVEEIHLPSGTGFCTNCHAADISRPTTPIPTEKGHDSRARRHCCPRPVG
jgi:hypothetical protein